MEELKNIPAHVAIILDGNGRWAKAKGMPRNYGHMQGAKAVGGLLFTVSTESAVLCWISPI